MRIKNITEYRTFYKTKVLESTDTNRDEHYIGAKAKRDDGTNVYGFFTITHGDKIKDSTDGIKGFLEGFLDMARDTQAVYEFLQNAIDANSSRFLMLWGKDENSENDYLLIINNGYQFDFASVRSILNVGVSTKSQEEHTIGKFGIGFKLAHRLVGKDNGLDELLFRNYGPILYSWQNKDFLRLLDFNESSEIDYANQYYSIEDESVDSNIKIAGCDPWLFKILITNFPVQPGELIKNLNYQNDSPFKNEELLRLVSWLNRYRYLIPEDEFLTGSLFFIRLGEGKALRLRDTSLEEGVKFSLAILNHTSKHNTRGLKSVHIQGSEIESADLTFESFTIPKESDEYKYVKFGRRDELNEDEKRIAAKDTDIQFLLGYTEFEKARDYFKNAPNFYLYFPLSEEKHNLLFILHSNAFYKASHRTSLQIGSQENYGINERLLEVFVQLISKKLIEWSTSGFSAETDKFLSLYPCLLFANRTEDADKSWINSPFINKIHDFLKSYIPVINPNNQSFAIVADPENVRIKSTAIPLLPSDYGLSHNWFYWSDNEPISTQIGNLLGITTFNIIDLLYINNSASKLNEDFINNPGLKEIVRNEINIYISIVSGTSEKAETFKENFYALKIFDFHDGSSKSINELNEPTAETLDLILFQEIEPIKYLLTKAGFNISTFGLSTLPEIQKFLRLRQSISYNDYKLLNEYLSVGFKKSFLTPTEKHTIFRTLEAAKDKEKESERNERMQVLSLYKNRLGKVVPLSALVSDEVADEWITPLKIDPIEASENIYRYVSSNENDIYHKVITPLWDTIVEEAKEHLHNYLESFFRDVVNYYSKTGQSQSLANSSFIPFEKQFLPNSPEIFYQPDWKSLSSIEYATLSSIMEIVFAKKLPNHIAIPFLSQGPFNLSTSRFSELSANQTVSLSRQQILLLVISCQSAGFSFFDNFIINNKDKSYTIRNRHEGETQVWVAESENLTLTYISKYYRDEMIICPKINELKQYVNHRDNVLCERFINDWDGIDTVKGNEIAKIIARQDNEIKYLFLKKIQPFSVELNAEPDYEFLMHIIKVIASIDDQVAIELFQSMFTITAEPDINFKLDEIVGDSTAPVYFGEHNQYKISISGLFPNEQTNLTQYVEQIIDHIKKEDQHINQSFLNTLFNLKEGNDKEIILDRLNMHLSSSGYLDKPSQIAFIVLYKKFVNHELDLEQYKLMIEGVETSLNNTFSVSSNFPLFNKSSHLPEKYNDLVKTLRLSSYDPYFTTRGFSLYLQPVIENDTLIGPRIRENLSEKEQIILLDFLCNYKNYPTSLQYQHNWSNVFGFEPKTKVSAAHCLSPDERLPDHIYNWSFFEENPSFKKKKAFLLSALGFNLPWSDINNLREYLLFKMSEKEIHSDAISEINSVLLANTLHYLIYRSSSFVFDSKDERFEMIKRIIKKCVDSHHTEIPLPVCYGSQETFSLQQLHEHEVLYLDMKKFQELSFKGITLQDLVNKKELKVYDTTKYWPDDDLIRQGTYEINLSEKIDINELINQRKEWSDQYYLKWKAEDVPYSIFHINELPKSLSIGNVFIKIIYENEIAIIDNDIYVPKSCSFHGFIQEAKNKNLIESQSASRLNTLYDQFQETIHELITNPIIDDELRKVVDIKKHELEILAKKKNLKESLAVGKFTHKWFIDFLELLILQDTDADTQKPEQEIVFGQASFEPNSERILKLKDPNRTVTATIEYCSNFNAEFISNKQKSVSVKIDSVQKIGQTILVLLTNTNDLKQFDLSELMRVELRFSKSMNLLEKLHQALKRLGYQNQWPDNYDLKANLTPNIKFIFGPPGTGKTTSLANRILQIMNSEPQAKILVLTPTNKAADVITLKIMNNTKNDCDWLVRFGAYFNSEIGESGFFSNGNTFIYEKYLQCTLITTIHRMPYEEIILNYDNDEPVKSKIIEMPWDYIIFDEASMIPIPYIALVLHQCAYPFENKATDFIVSGDPLQIPPVIIIEDEDLPDDFNKEENIYTMIGLNTFDENEQQQSPFLQNKVENLTTQYRSVYNIGRLFSIFSYHDKLIHHRSLFKDESNNIRPLPEGFQKLGIKPITLLTFPVNNENSIYSPSKLRNSPYQIYSSLLVFEVINYFNSSIEETEKHWSIGIICPYRSQASLINKMVESLDLKPNLSIITDTVHGFQGDECDMVFFLLIPPNYFISEERYRAFIHKHYLINVAISRAKDYLILLYPDNNTQGISNLIRIKENNPGSLEDIIKNHLSIDLQSISMTSSDLEKRLFLNQRNIEDNVFTNKHQLVNIYNKPLKNYYVRESSTAIDIQLDSILF